MLGHDNFVCPTNDERLLGNLPGKIVDELMARNWEVPGVTVEFHYFGTGAAKRVSVASVITAEARVDFTLDGRVVGMSGCQRQLDIWWDAKGLCSISFHLYTGGSWAQDAAGFMSGQPKFASRPGDEPQNHISYKGACNCPDVAGATFSSLKPLVSFMSGDPDFLRRAMHTHSGALPPSAHP